MFNEVYHVGEKISIEDIKSQITLIEVGRHFMRAEGIRGRKWFICMDGGQIKALCVRNNITKRVLNPKNVVPVIGFK